MKIVNLEELNALPLGPLFGKYPKFDGIQERGHGEIQAGEDDLFTVLEDKDQMALVERLMDLCKEIGY